MMYNVNDMALQQRIIVCNICEVIHEKISGSDYGHGTYSLGH